MRMNPGKRMANFLYLLLILLTMCVVILNPFYCIFLQLLEEMVDNGFPLATESNILKELIRPPSILPSSVVSTITGKSQ